MAMVMQDRDYRNSAKRLMPKRWPDDLIHTRAALDVSSARWLTRAGSDPRWGSRC